MRVLGKKKELFVSEYFNANMNATAAARRMGYANARASGNALRNDADVSRMISERVTASAMGADECLARIGMFARASLEDVCEIDPATGKPCRGLKRGLEEGTLHLVKSVTDSVKNGFGFEMYDSLAALKLIAQAHGLLKERGEAEVAGALDLLRDVLGVTRGDAE